MQGGDTLYSIALKYNTTPNAIINKNNLSSTTLVIGQMLKIPSDTESTGEIEDTSYENFYIVQKGDSLWSIANKNNISINELKNINNLTSDVLTIGQLLMLPSSLNNNNDNNNSNLYVVKKGDNLWSISRKYNVSINSIRMINNLTSDVLTIGQTLIIP